MTLAFLDALAASARDPAAALEPLALSDSVWRHLRAALERRRWRRAAARLMIDDHLRRDVGLPPLSERRW